MVDVEGNLSLVCFVCSFGRIVFVGMQDVCRRIDFCSKEMFLSFCLHFNWGWWYMLRWCWLLYCQMNHALWRCDDAIMCLKAC